MWRLLIVLGLLVLSGCMMEESGGVMMLEVDHTCFDAGTYCQLVRSDADVVYFNYTNSTGELWLAVEG